MESKRAKELAEAHWNGYVKPMLHAHGQSDEIINVVGFHYISATVHGHKHGVIDERNGLFRPRIGQHPPAHPYYHRDELPLSPEEVKAINEALSPPSLCGTCIRQNYPLDCAEHTTECGEYLPQGVGSEPAQSKQWTHEPEAAEFTFSFPAAEKYMGKSSVDYINKLREEIQEVEDTDTMTNYAIELLDVIHVAETALRTLAKDGMDLQDLADHVIAKNRQRGYYTKG